MEHHLKPNWMIYGANGYTARLAVNKALSLGLRPVLAGRNKQKISRMAEELGLKYRIFQLVNVESVAEQLVDIKVISHCAGPFSATAEIMMQACLNAGTHYTDITGEIEVFEKAQSLHEKAKNKAIVICNGVGFDVIPTDCIAYHLKQAMQDANHLCLGFHSSKALSPGTAKTTIEGIAKGMLIRRDGKLITVNPGFDLRTIDYGKGTRDSIVIRWGDLSTAYWQTGIPNITVYTTAMKNKLPIFLYPIIKRLTNFKCLQNFTRRQIEKRLIGPTEKMRKNSNTYIWGEAKNPVGNTITARVKVSNGYTLTMDGIILSAQFLMTFNGQGGYYTPVQLMGAEILEKLPGTGKIVYTTN